MSKIRALVTSMGSNTSIGVAKALKSHGIEVFGSDINEFHQCPGVQFVSRIFKVPHASSESFDDTLLKIIKENAIDCVIPIHDLEIEKIAELAEQHPSTTNWAVNLPELVKLCNDKRGINQLLSKHISVPEVYNHVSAIKYPFIVKPNRGVSSAGMKIFLSSQDGSVDAIGEDYLVQQFIEGTEYTVDCYTSYQDPDIFVYAVRERIETKSGMSTKGKIVSNEVLGSYCKKIHRVLGYRGASNIQFIQSENQYFFIEINPRFAGGGVLTYFNGLNMPFFTVAELNGALEPFQIGAMRPKVGYKMVRYLTETYFDEENNII